MAGIIIPILVRWAVFRFTGYAIAFNFIKFHAFRTFFCFSTFTNAFFRIVLFWVTPIMAKTTLAPTSLIIPKFIF